MVTLNFENFSKVVVQDGLTHIPKGKTEVTNSLAEEQKAKGLILLTIKSGEIMSVHSNIVNDKQLDSSRPKLKGKSCNAITLSHEDGISPATSLNSSEEEEFTLIAQLATSQSVGTQSGKQYLNSTIRHQWDTTTNDIGECCTSSVSHTYIAFG